MPLETLSEKKWFQVADWFTRTDEQNARIIELLETLAGTGPTPPPPPPPATIEALLKSIDEKLIPVSEKAEIDNMRIDNVCLELNIAASTTELNKTEAKEITATEYHSAAYAILFYNSGCGSGQAKVQLMINGTLVLPLQPTESDRAKKYIALNAVIDTFPLNYELKDRADMTLYGWNDDAANAHKITCIVGLRREK
jgi:hypothetical protein